MDIGSARTWLSANPAGPPGVTGLRVVRTPGMIRRLSASSVVTTPCPDHTE
ncbi:hypothetical protein GCM10010452_60820 [Crossiella cryophila]